jgi:hypothetical protein
MDYKSRNHVLKCPGAALDSPGRGTERKDLPMQHEPTATAAEDDDRIDKAVIHLLADPDQPWSEDEIVRELTGMDRIAVIDSLARLRGKGGDPPPQRVRLHDASRPRVQQAHGLHLTDNHARPITTSPIGRARAATPNRTHRPATAPRHAARTPAASLRSNCQYPVQTICTGVRLVCERCVIRWMLLCCQGCFCELVVEVAGEVSLE